MNIFNMIGRPNGASLRPNVEILNHPGVIEGVGNQIYRDTANFNTFPCLSSVKRA
jgi:hypothetical protein